MYEKVKFVNVDKSDFFPTVKKRVENYFAANCKSTHANGFMIFKAIFCLGILTAAYFLLILGKFDLPVIFSLWIIIGFFTAFSAVNVCHDAIHGALSGNKNVNKIFWPVFAILGASPYVWSIMHNIAHHTYPNIEGHDEDIEQMPILLRMSPNQKLKKIHRHQYWFAFLLYGLTSLSWVFIKDYKKFFQKKIGNCDNMHHPKIEYFNLFFYKALYYTIYLIIPIIMIEIPWWQVVLGFLVLHFFEGFTLAIIFMLAHIVEEAHFPIPDEDGKIKNAWAVHQLYTTVDFARNSAFVSFFTGGLNFQIEHHLFPQICHIHYKPISEIVQKTAYEYNIPYFENPTFFGAIRSHIRLLKKFGREEIIAHGA